MRTYNFKHSSPALTSAVRPHQLPDQARNWHRGTPQIQGRRGLERAGDQIHDWVFLSTPVLLVRPLSAPLALTDIFHYLYISYLAGLRKKKTKRLAADFDFMMLNPNIKKAALRIPGTTNSCIYTLFPKQSIIMMYNVVHTFMWNQQ